MSDPNQNPSQPQQPDQPPWPGQPSPPSEPPAAGPTQPNLHPPSPPQPPPGPPPPGYQSPGYQQPDYGQGPQQAYQAPAYQQGYQRPEYQEPGYQYGYQGHASQQQQQRSGSVATIAVVIMLVLLLIGGAVGAWWYFSERHDGDSAVLPTITGQEDDQADEPEEEEARIEDTEAGLSYEMREGWTFTGSEELIDEFSSEYMINGDGTNEDVGVIYGAWGEPTNELALAQRAEDMVLNNAYYFFPNIESVEELSSESTMVSDIPAHDSRILINDPNEPQMYVRVFVVENQGRLAALIGFSDDGNDEVTGQLNEIMDSMEVIDHD
ncbi:hypothetical protein [Natronoglycomyces albus]|uniref:Tad domain-containing protein n=1 Tax=Natronoglycomyces albus TaxID=2811108 RepID=A0A895XKF9_9ACTN|nr:hypothetical protein [Natronoglycomyces albus]QSB05537.1 Tad domain-containing protein [Natronoglycomyces albus]